jgi:hypothetical protein
MRKEEDTPRSIRVDNKEFLLLTDVSMIPFLEFFFNFSILFKLILVWKSDSIDSLEIIQALITQPIGS